MLNFLFLGNDNRSKIAAKILKEKYKYIKTTVLEETSELTYEYDVYVLPIPLSLNNITLNNSKVDLAVSELSEKLSNKALIISGGTNVIQSINVAQRDDFAYKNAIPTAEGAISIAINATDISLSDSKILITGFGKVSKILAKKLEGLCEDISIAVRKQSDLALINTLGFKGIPIEKLAKSINQYNIIFNSVPYQIFTKELLEKADKNSIFIELASSQLGFDTDAITELEINYINAPGLPNKVAPVSAAQILAETIYNILEEQKLI